MNLINSFKEQKNRDTIVPKSADKFIRCWKWKILVIFGNLKLVRERVYLCCSCYVGWIRILRDKEEEGKRSLPFVSLSKFFSHCFIYLFLFLLFLSNLICQNYCGCDDGMVGARDSLGKLIYLL